MDNSNQTNENFTVSRTALNYVVIAAVFLVIGILLGTFISGSSLTKADVEDVVRSAFADEVASLPSVSGPTESVSREELESIVRSAVEQMGDNETARLADDDPYLGAEDAPVVIVEFSDFNCSFCSRFADETLPQILDNYGEYVRFVYRDMPILTETSAPTAAAAQCMNEQGMFWEFHNYLFENREARDRDSFISYVEDQELDVEAFTECFDSNRYNSEVTLDLLDGQSLGVRGTPAFFINGRFVSGAQPFEIFKTVIDAELQRAGIPLPSGAGG